MTTLTGTYKLRSFETERDDGSIGHPYGDSPTGMLIYTDDGHMSVAWASGGRDAGRVSFNSSERRAVSDEDAASAYRSYGSYFGTYEVDEAAGIVTHHVESNLFPDRSGSSQTRKFTLDGETLTLEVTPVPADVAAMRLVWVRAGAE